MMLPDYVKHKILDLAGESWTPLFEVTFCVRDCMPDRTVDEQIEVAKRFVHVMLAHGLLKLWYLRIAAREYRNKQVATELTKEERRREMNDRSNWLTRGLGDPDEKWVTIALTRAGEGRVYQGKLPDY